MSFFRLLFGGGPPARGTLDLPPQFDGKTSYREMFRTQTREQLHDMCDALPVEQLDLSNPGRPPTAREMGRAITQIFAVATYMATKNVPTEYGDRLFPRLITKIAHYHGSELHLELCDLVRDFAINLEAGGRHRQAIQVLRVLQGSLFWHVGSYLDGCLFAALSNLAFETKEQSDFRAALDFVKQLPDDQMKQFEEVIKNLHEKMAFALVLENGATETKAQLVLTIQELMKDDQGDLTKTLEYATATIAAGNRFIIASNSSAQNMVTTAESKVQLTTEEWQSVSADAACANRPRDIPGGDDTFTVQRSPQQAQLAKLMPALARAGVDTETRQAAVWIVTDDADYGDLGILVASQFGFGGSRVINEQETARAMRILDEAGIDIRTKAIWRDRQRVLSGLKDGDLKTWLEQK